MARPTSRDRRRTKSMGGLAVMLPFSRARDVPDGRSRPKSAGPAAGGRLDDGAVGVGGRSRGAGLVAVRLWPPGLDGGGSRSGGGAPLGGGGPHRPAHRGRQSGAGGHGGAGRRNAAPG